MNVIKRSLGIVWLSQNQCRGWNQLVIVLCNHSFKRHNLRIFELFVTVKIDLKGRKWKFRDIYPVHIRALVSLYQLTTNKCTINYRYAPHNDNSVNDGPHIQKKKNYMLIVLTDLFNERNAFYSMLCHIHIRELVSIYQINTDTCTHILLNRYFNPYPANVENMVSS